MGDLTRADYQTRVLLALGNLDSSHPVIAAGMHTTAINNAADRIFRIMPDLHPEHQNRSWTLGPTVAGESRTALPENLFNIEKVTCTHSDDDPGDWADVQEFIVAPVQATTIGLIAKPSTTTGYPTLYDRKATDLLYNPTTQAGYECYFRLYGTSREEPLASSGSTFRLNRAWDHVIVLLAAAETAEMIGWAEKAAELTAQANSRIESTVSIMGRERALRPAQMRPAGLPR